VFASVDEAVAVDTVELIMEEVAAVVVCDNAVDEDVELHALKVSNGINTAVKKKTRITPFCISTSR
jgi:hypothetical protein